MCCILTLTVVRSVEKFLAPKVTRWNITSSNSSSESSWCTEGMVLDGERERRITLPPQDVVTTNLSVVQAAPRCSPLLISHNPYAPATLTNTWASPRWETPDGSNGRSYQPTKLHTQYLGSYEAHLLLYPSSYFCSRNIISCSFYGMNNITDKFSLTTSSEWECELFSLCTDVWCSEKLQNKNAEQRKLQKPLNIWNVEKSIYILCTNILGACLVTQCPGEARPPWFNDVLFTLQRLVLIVGLHA